MYASLEVRLPSIGSIRDCNRELLCTLMKIVGYLVMCKTGYGSGAPPSYRPPVALPPGSAPTQYYSNNGPSQIQYSASNGAPQVNVLYFSHVSTL